MPKARMGLRSRLALSGGLGVAGSGVLTGGALLLLQRMGLKPLISGLGTWGLLGFLLLFSLAEIPIMIFGMRHMVSGASGARLATLTNIAFTFFAAVYAAPFLLLTGQVGIGVALAGLSVVRFAGAMWFVPGGQHPAPNSRPSTSGNSHVISHSEQE